MKTLIFAALLVSACSSAPFEPSTTDAGAAPDAADANLGDASPDTASDTGHVCVNGYVMATGLCQAVIVSVCQQRVQCQGTSSCDSCADNCKTGASCTTATCVTAMAGRAPLYDCSQPRYNVKRCYDDVFPCFKTQMTCVESRADSWNWTPECSAFWASFP